MCRSVVLQGSAVGKGISNGSFKGQRFFTCPDGCALFLPASKIRLRRWSRNDGSDGHERSRDRDPLRRSSNTPSNGHPSNDHPTDPLQHSRHQPIPSFISRTAESAPDNAQTQKQVHSLTSPGPFHVGQRVCIQQRNGVCGGEVRFSGLLPGSPSSGMHVGILLVSTSQHVKLIYDLMDVCLLLQILWSG